MGGLDAMLMLDEVRFVDKTHQYFNLANEEYTSVSKCLKRLEVPFDREGVSRRMAISQAEELGRSVEEIQAEILKEWDGKKDSSIDKGNYVHDGLYEHSKTGKIWDALEEPVKFMSAIYKQYYRFYPETLLYSHDYKVAGRTDLILQRQKSRIPVYDFIDYKSNEAKGIQFDSIGRKEGAIKHYNRFFLPPLDHLEACNYTLYSLQLSIYAFLLLCRGNCRIGKLAIIFFDNEFKPTYIPVPFMYYEAKLICEQNTLLKALPTVSGISVPQRELDPIKAEMIRRQYPATPNESFKITDDWE